MLNPEDVQHSNPLKFNPKDIKASLKEKKVYEKDNFTIKTWGEFNEISEEKDDDDLMFIIQNKDKTLPFLGVVNYIFKREGYCLNTYANGDIYFGFFASDQRNRQGIYEYKPKKVENEILYQYYYGLWKNDLFNGNGIYLWLKEKEDTKPFNKFDNSNFYAFVGQSTKGVFEKGALLKKEKNSYLVYYGTLSPKGKKEGKNCFYFNSNSEELCYGTYENGRFIEGFVGKFNNNGTIKRLIKYKRLKKTAKIKGVNPQKEPCSKTLEMIRNVLMSENYFGIIYEEIKQIINYRNEKMNNVDIFLSDEYTKVMDCFNTFNKVTICKDIENNVEFYEII
jgi:hypothetical protein